MPDNYSDEKPSSEREAFLLLYKHLEKGNFIWPRNESKVRALTGQQFCWLMEGLNHFDKSTLHITF